MSTLSLGTNGGLHSSSKQKHQSVKKTSISELKKKQISDFKQGLKEAILISRGDIKGIPLSELWDE